MVEFSLPRGMRDITPDEWESAEIVRGAFIDTCALFDYKVMEPSSLELLETLEAKSGPGIRDEIYFFKDKSDRELGLRFDLTVGLTRYATSKRELSPPIRLASFGSMWRYDEPQYGRYRWFYQWDVELFGPSSAQADAEIIEFSSLLFTKLGLKPRVLLGSRRIVESFITQDLKISEESRILDSLRAIDKLSKKTLDEISEEYKRSISKEELSRLSDFVKLKGERDKVSQALSEFRLDSAPLLNIIDALKSRGVSDVEINLGIVRGIDYYTDMVFEAVDRDNPRLGSLCGGGRYDSLPAVYDRSELGATGVAGGVERAVLSLQKNKPSLEKKNVYVAPIGSDPQVINTASSVAAQLRRAGIRAQSEIGGRSLRKILEVQSSSGTRAVVIIGPKELAENSAKVKWLASGEEVSARISELEKLLK